MDDRCRCILGYDEARWFEVVGNSSPYHELAELGLLCMRLIRVKSFMRLTEDIGVL